MAHDDNASSDRGTPRIDEDALIDRIRARFTLSREGDLGIGDDGAILRDPRPVVVTTDLLIEETDFSRETPRWFVGKKALAANLSDLAAMGAEPDSFLLTLGLPDRELSTIDDLLDGLADRASSHGIVLVGGDLSSAERLIISITAIGRTQSGRTLLRSGARDGESIFVSRPLGGSAAGLQLLQKGWRLGRDYQAVSPDRTGFDIRELAASLLRAHLDPVPEIDLGVALSKLDGTGACIDLSDGISRDLARICDASGVGAVIDWERVPVVPDLDRLGARLGIDPFACAIHGGEEFSLLFTARASEAQLSSTLGRPVYKIGMLDTGEGVRMKRGGAINPLPALGWDHFGTG